MSIDEQTLIEAVKNFPGGCKEKKEEFLQSFGLSMAEEVWEVTIRVTGTSKTNQYQYYGKHFSEKDQHMALWRYGFGEHGSEARKAIRQALGAYPDGLDDVSMKVVGEKKIR